mmetsp:Transcript_12772/g.36065  ORF Transcript_12772/g.36065 Transcript_12772/m.36065 type:complete len:348 (+) Transcript_12772:97-1140(+)
MVANNCRKLVAMLSMLQLLIVLAYDNRSIFSSALSLASTPQSTAPECAVVGVGVLGTSLCKQLLRDPDLKDWKVTGITKSTKRHEQILKEVLGDDDQYSDRFELRTSDDNSESKKFNHCVFCAPPSGFEDYPSAVKAAIDDLWMGQSDENSGGAFVFTSSGGIYGSGGDEVEVSPIVTESSPLTSVTPRIERLVNAEKEVLKYEGGSVLRLAGLYLLDRGAHNFWLGDTAELTKEEISGRPDSMINLLHYDDAAGSVVAALKKTSKSSDDDSQEGKIFLVSDGHPMTRLQICESSLKNPRYADRTIPRFGGSKENGDPIGKIYDGSYTNKYLEWTPRYESFDKFMSL